MERLVSEIRLPVLALLWSVLAPATLAGDAGAQPSYAQTDKVLAGDATSNLFFGVATSMSGATAAIGASSDDQVASGAGAVYIFERGPGGWQQAAKITAADGAEGDGLGFELSLDGDTLAATAWRDDDHGTSSGSVYIFERDAGGPDAWGQVAKVTAFDGAALDYFGTGVDLQGDTLAVGAFNASPGGLLHAGAVYVFERDAAGPDGRGTRIQRQGSWGLVAKLASADLDVMDHFGTAVGVSGDTVIAGARMDDDNGFNSGSAYVFERHAGGTNAWGQVAKLVASDGAPADRFGRALAVEGDTAVVSAPADGTGEGWSYVFERRAGSWIETAKLEAPDSRVDDWFGGAVDLSGDRIVIGADDHDSLGIDSGAAYVYERDAGGSDAWGQVAKLVGRDTTTGDQLGRAASVSGNAVMVGADLDDDLGASTGSVYFFDRIVVDPFLSLSGPCPGEQTLSASGLTPDRIAVLYMARALGGWQLLGGACAGTPLELDIALPVGARRTDAAGNLTVVFTAGQALCGGFAQLIDSVSCATSGAVELP